VLDHLEHPRLVADHQPAGLLSILTEFAGFARAPFRVQIAGGHDGNERGRLLEASDDLVGKDIVALQLGISPNLRIAAHPHAQDGRQRCMKPVIQPMSPGVRLIVDGRS
jgi:hypothetical protein